MWPDCIRLRYVRCVRVCRTESRAPTSEWCSLTTWRYEILALLFGERGAAFVLRINIGTRAYAHFFCVPRVLLISLSLQRTCHRNRWRIETSGKRLFNFLLSRFRPSLRKSHQSSSNWTSSWILKFARIVIFYRIDYGCNIFTCRNVVNTLIEVSIPREPRRYCTSP